VTTSWIDTSCGRFISRALVSQPELCGTKVHLKKRSKRLHLSLATPSVSSCRNSNEGAHTASVEMAFLVHRDALGDRGVSRPP